MKILFLATKIPFPPDEGGRVATYHLWQELRRHGADLRLAFPLADRSLLRHVPAEVTVYPLAVDSRWRATAALRSLVRGKGYFMGRFFTPGGLEDLRALARSERFDVVHTEGVYLAGYAHALKQEFGLPTVLRTQNIESDILAQHASRSSNPMLRWYARIEAARAHEFEQNALRVFDHVLAITTLDERRIRALAPDAKTLVIPGGVDAVSLRQQQRHVPDAVLLFTNYKWRPNKEAADDFMRKVYPVLLSRRPGVRLVVAGSHTESFRAPASGGRVEVRGYVGDLNELTDMASVAVVPLLVGGGMRMKLITLMALGMAVVTTSVGAEGIGGRHGEHYLLADDPGEFAAAVDALLAAPEKALRIGREARQFVQEHFSWHAIGDRVFDFYRSIIAGGGAVTAAGQGHDRHSTSR